MRVHTLLLYLLVALCFGMFPVCYEMCRDISAADSLFSGLFAAAVCNEEPQHSTVCMCMKTYYCSHCQTNTVECDWFGIIPWDVTYILVFLSVHTICLLVYICRFFGAWAALYGPDKENLLHSVQWNTHWAHLFDTMDFLNASHSCPELYWYVHCALIMYYGACMWVTMNKFSI